PSFSIPTATAEFYTLSLHDALPISLHEGPERRGIGMADQQIPLPMPRHRAIGHLRRTFVDTDQVLDGARREPDLAGPAKPGPATQIAGELPLEGPAGQHIEIGVDGFVRDPHRWVVRIPLRQPTSNLFGGPALREQAEDRRAQ